MKIIKQGMFIFSLPAYAILIPIFMYYFFKSHPIRDMMYLTEQEVVDEYRKFSGGNFWKFRFFAFLLSFVIYYTLYRFYAIK